MSIEGTSINTSLKM